MTAASARPSASAPATDWLAVLAAFGCGIAVAVNVGKVPISLATLREEFGLSLVAAGWVASMLNTLAVFAAVFFGIACDRIGHLRMAGIGLVLSIVGALIGLFANDSNGLLLSRVVEGAGVLSVVVAAPALVSAAALPADRHFALGIWAAYMPAGVGLAMLLAPLVMPVGGWRALWLASICGFDLRLRSRGVGLASPAQILCAAASRSTPAFLCRRLCSPGATGAVAARLCPLHLGDPAVRPDRLAADLPQGAARFGDHHRGPAVGADGYRQCAGQPARRRAGSTPHRSRQAHRDGEPDCGLLNLAIYLDVLSDWPRYVCCVALSFFGGLIPASVLSSSAALAKSPRQIGALQGLFMQCANLGQFAGPPLIAALVAHSGLWRDTLFVTGGAAVTGILLGLLAIHRTEQRPVHASAG